MVGPGISGKPFGIGVGFGFRKQDNELREAFNRVIAELGKDGTMTALYTKWFGYDLTPAGIRP